MSISTGIIYLISLINTILRRLTDMPSPAINRRDHNYHAGVSQQLARRVGDKALGLAGQTARHPYRTRDPVAWLPVES